MTVRSYKFLTNTTCAEILRIQHKTQDRDARTSSLLSRGRRPDMTSLPFDLRVQLQGQNSLSDQDGSWTGKNERSSPLLFSSWRRIFRSWRSQRSWKFKDNGGIILWWSNKSKLERRWGQQWWSDLREDEGLCELFAIRVWERDKQRWSCGAFNKETRFGYGILVCLQVKFIDLDLISIN